MVTALLLCIASGHPHAGLSAATANAVERGTFALFKFEQPIGEEKYELASAADGGTLKADFTFTDRGTAVALTATVTVDSAQRPSRLVMKGRTARFSAVDLEVAVTRDAATIRDAGATRTVPGIPGAFAVAGYAPVSIQMQLMRYWQAHGRPSSIPLLPRGTARIEFRGHDLFDVDGRRVALDRYSVSGIVWGRESLWCDGDGRLAALVTVDAEFDHFEAAVPDLAGAIPQFVERAASDAMAASAERAYDAAAAVHPVVAVTGATIVQGVNAPALAAGTVVIRKGRIEAVGPASAVTIPPDAALVDATGRTIIPGLWDMHAHFEQVEWGPIYLASGMTTVRDCGNELEFIKAVRDSVAEGKGVGPRLLLAGVIDGDGPRTLGVARAATPEAGRAWVHRYRDAGFDQIKIYSSVTAETLRAITAEAHALGLTVTGHVPEGLDALAAIDLGLDQINHRGYLDALMARDPVGTIAALKAHGTVIDPTLALSELINRPFDRPIADFEPGVRKIAPELAAPLNGFGLPPQEAARVRKQEIDGLGFVGALHRAGIPIVAGTDQAVPGYSLHRELELYVEAGFTPLEALQAATIVAARAMKRESDVGTIEVGKRGDLVVLDANPLDDIHNTRRVYRVITNGRILDPAPLWRSVGFEP